jgi:hypothetical protein
MKPRKSLGVEIFAIPTLQLGDIVEVDYKESDGTSVATTDGSRFVVYNIEYDRGSDELSHKVYLAEV